MNKQTMARVGIKEPNDGFNDIEKTLAKLLTENTISTLYNKLPTSRMKAIVAMHFELGYSQEIIGEIFGVSQEQIALEIKNIQRVLTNQKYRPHKYKPEVTPIEFFGFCYQMLLP